MLDSDEAIAVVGVSARLVGAADVEQFWLRLVAGRTSSTPTAGEAVDPAGLDTGLFRLTASELDGWDPRARLLLQVAHSAVENAGYDPGRLAPGVGVFAWADDLDGVSADRLDIAATAVACALDLRGPSVTVGTSALAALHLACRSLGMGGCDAALVAGVSTGGAGAVLVKRLSDALADHDHVSAVVRGTAVHHDGAGGSGRIAAVIEAMAVAGMRPEDVSYVEVDGRDDVAALAEAYRSADPVPAGRCGIGSVAATFGHLGPVAGLAGLIKAVLALERQQLPPGAPVAVPDGGPFHPVDRLAPWPADPHRPRRAAVASFGADGSNACAVVEEAPPWRYPMHAEQPRVVVWSGLTAAAERTVRHRLATYFVWRGEEVFAGAVATLQHGRAAHPFRAAAVCTGALDAAAVLGAVDSERVVTAGRPVSTPGAVTLLFRGHGSPDAARDLYRDVPAFAVLLDGWLDRLDGPERSRRERWSAGAGGMDVADTALRFAVEAALAQLLRQAGIRPAALASDGVGALAAATVAGILRPEDAATVVRALASATRGGATGGGRRDGAADVLERAFHGVAAEPPTVPFYSTVTGRQVTAEEAVDPAFWAAQLAAPAGRAGIPAALAGTRMVTVQPAGTVALLTTAAQLWTEGHGIAWEQLGQEPLRHRVALPTYPVDAGDGTPARPLAVAVRPTAPRDGRRPTSGPNGFELLSPPAPGPLVVAIPYAGASGRAFQRVRPYLPPGCGLALVDLPGHGRRMDEPCLRDVDAVVAELLDALPALPARRLLLLGYSLGGSFAYELAVRLAEAGTPAEGLVVCGTRAPQTGVGHPPVAHLPPGEPFLRAAVDLEVAAPQMLELPELAEAFAGPLQADLSMVESFPYRSRRPRLAVPVAVVGLRCDWLVPEPSLRAWDDVCRYPPLHLRVDGGHLALHEREREFGEAVGAAVAHVLGAGRDPSVPTRSTGRAPSASLL